MQKTGSHWFPYIQQYRKGVWRARVFRDMILDDIEDLKQQNSQLALLDIGCGGGFDNHAGLQESLSQAAGHYIGVEPDKEIELGSIFSQTHRCMFEDAPIEDDSIDLAFTVMVLEHFEKPQLFWDKVYAILKKNGVFWGYTVDARHWFVFASLLTEKLQIKDWYLNQLYGKRGEDRYENYGVFYRSNTPRQIKNLTTAFSSTTFLNFHRIGQMDYYFPEKFRWIGRALDHITIGLGLPGSILAVRVQK